MGWGLCRGFVAATVLFGAGPSLASVTVFGDSFASTCSKYARDGRLDVAALDVCGAALSEGVISRHDLAATYVNRATIHLHRQDWPSALVDLNAALAVDQSLGEARVNRGAVYIAQGKPRDAITEIDAGLQLGSDEPEKAYYNRAIANELMDDVRGAYFDYRKAADLAPKWTEPQQALTRFKVSAKN